MGASLSQLVHAVARASGGSIVISADGDEEKVVIAAEMVASGTLVRELAASRGLAVSVVGDLTRLSARQSSSTEHRRKVVRYQLFQSNPMEVSSAIKSLFSDHQSRLRLIPDLATGGLLVHAPTSLLAEIDSVVTLLDAHLQQIHVECWLVEVSHELDKRIGIALRANEGRSLRGGGDSGQVFNALPQGSSGLTLLRSAGRLRLALEAFQSQGHSKVLANPRIVVRERVESVLFQGQEVPYITQSDNAGTRTEFRQAGIRLKVMAHSVGEHHVLLRLGIAQDAVDPGTANPPISRRELETQVVVPKAMIAMIGGIEIVRSGVDSPAIYADKNGSHKARKSLATLHFCIGAAAYGRS